MIFAYGLAVFLSMLFAMAELFTKFRDEPFHILARLSAWAYILLNMLIAAVTLYVLIHTEYFRTGEEMEWMQAALVAGLGSLVLMRSKFLKLNIQGKEVAVGPEMIINVFLETLERQIDRDRALLRKKLVEEHMQDIDFDRVKEYVVSTIIGASQTVSPEATRQLMENVKKIDASPMQPADKSYALGYLILDTMGEKFLKEMFTDRNQGRFGRQLN